MQRHLQGSATRTYPPCKDTCKGVRPEDASLQRHLQESATEPCKDTCEGRLGVSGARPLTYAHTGADLHVANSTATIAGPAKEAESVQTVVCPNMTQEGCDKARLSSHPNDMGSAESQLGHKHISNKQTDDPNGTRPPRPDQPPGKRSRTKPAHTQNNNMQHRGRSQPQPVHLNQTQPRNSSGQQNLVCCRTGTM